MAPLFKQGLERMGKTSVASLGEALENNYSLAAARERMKTAERGLQLAKSGHHPTIDAQVQYAHSVSGGTSFLGNKID